MTTANTQNHEDKCTHVAAFIYYLGQEFKLAYQDINAVIRLALAMLDHGSSPASAYEAGAKTIRIIAGNIPLID